MGLTRRQIEGFTWQPEIQTLLFAKDVAQRTAAALRERQNLLGMGDDYGTPQLKREKLEKADELLDLVRFIGDAAIAAYFSADKDKAREQKRVELAERIAAYLNKGDLSQRPTAEVAALRSGEFPVTPFHWEIEFPEVFERENPGFDAFVGNPPFAGKNNLLNGNREGYLDWLKTLHVESHGNADLVAHFFRHAFNLLRQDGCFGLIATNTIGQGDTRASGLRWLCTHGGTIYAARKRAKWPGQAAVVVSVVNVTKGQPEAPFDLDGRTVPVITAYLFHAGGHENPAVLMANAGRSFIGSYLLGMGFTFDDTYKSGVSTPLAAMRELIARSSPNAERIFPYLGGEEVNDHPEHRYHRFVINFADFPLRRSDLGQSWADADERQREAWLRTGIVPHDYAAPVAADWPDLLDIVERKVKPERLVQKDQIGRTKWWLFLRARPELAAALVGKTRTLTIPRVTQHVSFAFLPTNWVLSEQLVVLASNAFSLFCVIQSSSHEVWAGFSLRHLKNGFATRLPPASRPSRSQRAGRRTLRWRRWGGSITSFAPR